MRDAEMLIRVGYEVLVRSCAYRFNLKSDEGLSCFLEILNHETDIFVQRLLKDKTVLESGDPVAYANKIMRFANSVTFANAAKYGFATRISNNSDYKPMCFGSVDNNTGDGIQTAVRDVKEKDM